MRPTRPLAARATVWRLLCFPRSARPFRRVCPLPILEPVARARPRRVGVLRVAIACAAVALTSASTALGLSLFGVTTIRPATAAAASSTPTAPPTTGSTATTSLPAAKQPPSSSVPTVAPTTEPPTTVPTVLECPYDGGPCIAAASCDSSSYQCEPLPGNGDGQDGGGSGRFHHGRDRSFGHTTNEVSDN